MPLSRKRCWNHSLIFVAAIAIVSVVVFGMENYWLLCHQGSTKRSFKGQDNLLFPDLVEMEFLKRQQRYIDACVPEKTGQIQGVFLDEPSGLAVCHTPKVGCTFWRRVMTFLHTKGNRWKSPFEINRFLVHHAKTVSVTHAYNSKYVKERIWNTTRVVFGRDPFSRLWSTYVDKILLPDSWKDFGSAIYRYRKLGKGKCPLNITFEDFLHYALYKKSNSHWDPLHTVCNPCDFYPKYVGKMETFSRDVTYILNKSGLGYLLNNQNHDRHVEDEISMLIDYFFKIHASRKINQMCLTITSLAERLWRAFKLNGYISLKGKFPMIHVNTSVKGVDVMKAKDIVTKIFVDYYKQNRRSSKDWKLQRRSVLVNAYKEIALRLREDIAKLYKRDFELFDYEQYPKDIFPNTKMDINLKRHVKS